MAATQGTPAFLLDREKDQKHFQERAEKLIIDCYLQQSCLPTVFHNRQKRAVASPTSPADSLEACWPAENDEGCQSLCSPVARFEIRPDDLIEREALGEGFHCVVVDAEFLSWGQRVAVRRVRARFDGTEKLRRRRLVQDVEWMAGRLQHPHIVTCVGVVLHGDIVRLVEELMGGGTLEDYYQGLSDEAEEQSAIQGEGGTCSRTGGWNSIVRWSQHLFSALEFLHGHHPPIILRDVTPRNLLLSADLQTLKIRNFALHKTACPSPLGPCPPELRLDPARLAPPSTKCFSDTSRYLAPEIIPSDRRAAEYNAAADVYSAGLVMWFMLTGARPWGDLHGHRAHAASRLGTRPSLEFTSRRLGLGADLKFVQVLACVEDPHWKAGSSARPGVQARGRHVQVDVEVGRASELGEVIGYCWDEDPADRPPAAHVLRALRILSDRDRMM
mmetsp:Transcript_48241/g.96564  ORF Transcript_48241/g.96564 Transcript_48241/m.96564 type:complete len:444 (+) Transcript_48241:31-1362(+)